VARKANVKAYRLIAEFMSAATPQQYCTDLPVFVLIAFAEN